uniref:Disrupted in renal carcinoma protein 2-like protein n=1 Tax=Magallana gigas TaxID=29159 RepID=A0A8W8NPE8_MAGGI|nr:solute carrier family 49 member 4-like [Crassostrea gigas]
MNKETDDPTASLLPADGQLQVYTRRWYVLTMFGMVNFTQNLVWNTWGPITQSAKAVFGWSDSQIGQFANMGNIAYLVTVFPVCYLMGKLGLRFSILGCTLLIFIGTGLRCITYEKEAATWLSYVCSVLNGIGGIVPFAGPSLVANTWFPLSERATATAVSSTFMYMGVGLSFIIGSEWVPSPLEVNSTGDVGFTADIESISRLSSSNSDTAMYTSNHSVKVINMDSMRTDIMNLLYSECGLAGLIFLLCLLYLPAKPPTPPSTSASVQRTNYKESLGSVARNKSLILLGLANAIPKGVFGSWQAVLDVLLDPVGMNQSEAGWLGFYMTAAGGVSGLLIGRFSDIFLRRTKFFLILMNGGAVLGYVWFSLMSSAIIPISKVEIYISAIIGGMFINGSFPLVYEMGSELAFPVSEAVVGGLLTCFMEIFGIFFLLVLMIPNIGTSWMNWSLSGSLLLGFVLLFLFPARYRRTDIDNVVVHVNAEDKYDDSVNRNTITGHPARYDE